MPLPGPWRRLQGRSRIWSDFPLLADLGEYPEPGNWSCPALHTSFLTAYAATLWRCCVCFTPPVNGRAISAQDGEPTVTTDCTEDCVFLSANKGLRFPVDNIRCILLLKVRESPPFFPEPSSAFPHRDPSKTSAGQGFWLTLELSTLFDATAAIANGGM